MREKLFIFINELLHDRGITLMDFYLEDEEKEELENIISENAAKLERYEKALQEIIDQRNKMEYVDEWKEAEAYNQSEEIAKAAFKGGEMND